MNVWQKFKGWIAKKMNFTVETSPAMKEESFLEWLGVKRKNKDVMAEVTYFTCLKMMSETLAKIPWKYYQKTDKGIIEPELSDVAKLLKNRPNPFMTPTAFWNAVEMNRNHFGNAYVYVRSKFKRKKYGGEYKVMDLWIMPSNCVQIVVDDEGYFGGRGKIWYVYNDKYSGQQYVFGTDEVLHFKTSHSLDGITGLPVQAILKTTVEGAAASQDYLNSLYESGLTGKATLEYTGDLNKDLKEKLVQAFEEFGSGAKNAGKIIPVPLGMKLTPLDIKLSDSQFIELKKYSALQIAAAFGIKPNQINDYTKSSYSNSEMQQLSFLTDTMLFVLKQYEEEVNYKLLTDEEAFSEGKYYKLNEKVLLRTDSKTQMEIFATGVQNGIQKVNECRRKLDLMDAEGGDQLIVNGNYIPITEVGKQYEKEDMPSVMIIDGKQYRWTVNSYFTLNTIVAQGTWVKKATLNIGTKLTIRKPFFKIVYGQNPTQEGTEMTFSFYDLGSFTPYGFNPGASEFEIDGKTAVPINIENANEDSLFSVKLSSDATYRFKWAIGSKSYTLDKKTSGATKINTSYTIPKSWNEEIKNSTAGSCTLSVQRKMEKKRCTDVY